ncbi:hypothetical protein FKM82_012052 [Ascaphus truei]
MENLQLAMDADLFPLYTTHFDIETDPFSRNSQNDRTQTSDVVFELLTLDQTNLCLNPQNHDISELYTHGHNEQRATQGVGFDPSTNVESVGGWEAFPSPSLKPTAVETQDETNPKTSTAQDLFWTSMLQAQLCVMELQDEIDKQEMPGDVPETFPSRALNFQSCMEPSSVDIEDERVDEDLDLVEGREEEEATYSEEEMEDESLFCNNPLFWDTRPLQPTSPTSQPSLQLSAHKNDIIPSEEESGQKAVSLYDQPLLGQGQTRPRWDFRVAGSGREFKSGIIHSESLEILQIYEDDQEESSVFSDSTENLRCTTERFPCPGNTQLSMAACNSTETASEISPGIKIPPVEEGLLFSVSSISLISALLLEHDSDHNLPTPLSSLGNPTTPHVQEELPKERIPLLCHETDAHPVCQGCQSKEQADSRLTSDERKGEEKDKEPVPRLYLDSPEIQIAAEHMGEVPTDRDLETSDTKEATHVDIIANGTSNDREAARRLATRLFQLDGFERSQVAPYLQKNNSFSAMVAEEYLSLFDFTGKTLDVALRSLLLELVLTGETQERERVLFQFSKRFHICNPKDFSSPDAVHTLTCGLMLLNSDLHGQGLYHSIRNEKLEWAVTEGELTFLSKPDNPLFTRKKSNPFLDMAAPDPQAPIYRQGVLCRKVHADIDGKKTPWGKRGWKAFYTVLKGMLLYFLKGEYRLDFQSPEEVISVHHALAERANDYTKRPHVFRMQTADWRVFLFQAQSEEEMNSWIARINLVAAMFSSPPFPAAIGSQKRFVRPILPSTQCKLSLDEQLQSHESWMDTFTDDLTDHQRNLPDRKSRARDSEDYHLREEYLLYEKSRFETYVKLLALRMQSGCDNLNTWESMLTEPDGTREEGIGLKRSHSSPSLNLESSPVVIKVKRNISERRTYRRIIPKRNKNLV